MTAFHLTGEGPLPAQTQPRRSPTLGYTAALFAALALALTLGCATEDTGESCDEECIDSYTGYGITEATRAIYNAHVAGTAEYNLEVACGLSGTVIITDLGGTALVNFTQQVNLSYDMTACRYAQDGYYDLSLTGTLTEDGTFDTLSDTASLAYASSSLTYTGTASDEDVTDTCDVNISQLDTGVSGTLCGRSFSY